MFARQRLCGLQVSVSLVPSNSPCFPSYTLIGSPAERLSQDWCPILRAVLVREKMGRGVEGNVTFHKPWETLKRGLEGIGMAKLEREMKPK